MVIFVIYISAFSIFISSAEGKRRSRTQAKRKQHALKGQKPQKQHALYLCFILRPAIFNSATRRWPLYWGTRTSVMPFSDMLKSLMLTFILRTATTTWLRHGSGCVNIPCKQQHRYMSAILCCRYIIILWNLNLISKDIFDWVRNPHLFDSIANTDCECRFCRLRLRLWLWCCWSVLVVIQKISEINFFAHILWLSTKGIILWNTQLFACFVNFLRTFSLFLKLFSYFCKRIHLYYNNV